MNKIKYYKTLLKSLSKTFKYLLEGRLTISNIKRWIQGNKRLLSYLNDELEDYKKEQFYFRLTRTNKECIDKKSCVICGCEIPGLQLVDSSCEKNCYPAMMNEFTWNIYKHINSVEMVEIENKALKILMEL